jgi:subtilisin family serine protease
MSKLHKTAGLAGAVVLSCLLVATTGKMAGVQDPLGPERDMVKERGGATRDTGPDKGEPQGGRVLVKFREDATVNRVDDLLATHGARKRRAMAGLGVDIVETEKGREEYLAQALSYAPEVEFAEPDRVVQPAEMTPNDPWYAGGNEWHLARIAAPGAWEVTTGSPNVVIAVLDTGIDAAHEDLTGKLVPGWNTYNGSADNTDVHGHGTSVAGAAAASSNNAMGVAAVAWGCKIMAVRVSDNYGNATYSTIASGLTWAADHGARVANISYMVTNSSTVTSAAEYFQSRGGVVVVAAGNSSLFDSAPDNPSVLTVSATDAADNFAGFSNYGNNIDLAAPGWVYTTGRGGEYGYVSGTSFSSPIVAGVAALMFSVNPGLTPAQAQTLIKQNADDFGAPGWDAYYGAGRVNATRAVQAAQANIDNVAPTITITSPANGAKAAKNVSVYSNAADNVGVVKVELYVDGVLTSTATAAPFTTRWSSTRGTHSLRCKAYDAAGNVGQSQVVSVYR